MRAKKVTADLAVADLESAKVFYTGYLGLSSEQFSLGWVASYAAPDAPAAHLQLMTVDATAPVNPVVSVHVDDVDAAYTEALERGFEIVHPLSNEEWGVRRFFVRAPDGNVVNIVQHR